MIGEEFEKVKEFHKVFGHPVNEKPVMLDAKRTEIRVGFMLEEIEEFLDAENIYEQADAMIDLIYFALGTLVEMGVKPQPVFDIVHDANMSKQWKDGTVKTRETDGKVIKPPEWEDPFPKIKKAVDGE